jgi:hypothetical protein
MEHFSVTYSSGGYFASSLAVADLNGDQKLDLVLTNYCGDSNISVCTNPGPVGVLLGNASGGAGTSTVIVADVNGDGRPDLVVTNCGSGGCGDRGHHGQVELLACFSAMVTAPSPPQPHADPVVTSQLLWPILMEMPSKTSYWRTGHVPFPVLAVSA